MFIRSLLKPAAAVSIRSRSIPRRARNCNSLQHAAAVPAGDRYHEIEIKGYARLKWMIETITTSLYAGRRERKREAAKSRSRKLNDAAE